MDSVEVDLSGRPPASVSYTLQYASRLESVTR